jgi:hypothetical protein
MLHFTDYARYNNYVDSDIQWIGEAVNWDEAISFTLPIIPVRIYYQLD